MTQASTALVPYGEWRLAVRMFAAVTDPVEIAEVKAWVAGWRAKAEAVQSGAMTREEAFGPFLDLREVREQAEQRHPTGPRRYPLPGHLHWTGQG